MFQKLGFTNVLSFALFNRHIFLDCPGLGVFLSRITHLTYHRIVSAHVCLDLIEVTVHKCIQARSEFCRKW